MIAVIASRVPEVPPLSQVASMIASLVQKPENGGIPMIARYPHRKVTCVTVMALVKAPNLRMSVVSSMPSITEPAERNIVDLKKPWASRCAMPSA